MAVSSKSSRALLATLVAGLASATGFWPLGWWPATLGGFAVLLWLVADAPGARSAFARAWWFGVGHFTVGLNWIAEAFTFQDAMPHWMGFVAVVGLSMYLALFVGAAALVGFALARTGGAEALASGRTGWFSSFALVFAGAWILTEYLRATLFTGFAWNPLAAIWAGRHPMGLLPTIGTYALSGVTILIAVLVGRLALWSLAFARGYPARLAAMRRDGTWPTGLLLPVLVPIGVLALVIVPLQPLAPDAPAVRTIGPLIRIVQPNIGQAVRNAEGSEEARIAALERLTGAPSVTPRLILWPEAAVPFFLEQERWGRDRVARVMGPRDLMVTGGDALAYDDGGLLVGARNSVFAMRPDTVIVDRYDKAHLVPGGEYLPMRPLMSAIGLARLVPGDLDFLPGPGPRTMTLPGFGRAGMQLCYEMIFSGQVVDRANRPDFIFNPSNDAWFGSWGPPQHLAQARLRAAEEGLPVVRSTPTGISAVIDAQGQLLAALPLGKPGFIQMRLPEPVPPTFFGTYGNSIPIALALGLIALGVAPHVAPRLRRRYGRAGT